MNTFYKKMIIYNKLNYNIQNIVLNKLFKQQKNGLKMLLMNLLKLCIE